jgi:type VI secretion system protein ImpK
MQAASAPAGLRADTLALLYQSVLTGIVRIQAGGKALTNIETFRTRMNAALQEVAQEASVAGYGTPDIRDAEFAVVAFLDETILSSKDPKAEEWRKRPLNVERFGQAIAGDFFFDKLMDIERRENSEQLADLLEVYLLCLLLGFEGRFAPPLRAEAHHIMERLRARIESIRRTDYKLSPPIEFCAGPVEDVPTVRWEGWWSWAVCALAVGVLFLLYKVILSLRIGYLESALFDLR